DGIKCHQCSAVDDTIRSRQPDCVGLDTCDGLYCGTTLVHSKMKMGDGRLNLDEIYQLLPNLLRFENKKFLPAHKSHILSRVLSKEEIYTTTKLCVREQAQLEHAGAVVGRCVKINETILKAEFAEIKKRFPVLPELAVRGAVCTCYDTDLCNNGLATSIDRVHSGSSTAHVFSTTKDGLCIILIDPFGYCN
uniref:Uncharacterized protein n=1 Tax=Romanomermis culicivorax TaxID=13658 RepID=A0A915JK84_ROMCU